MPLETLRPDVIAEIKKDRETRQRQAFEDRIEASVNTFNRRLMRLETQPRSNPGPVLDEDFAKRLRGDFPLTYVDTKCRQAEERE